jgi:biotin carboxyl carrier protein
MMFEVEVDGRNHAVSVEPLETRAHQYRLTIDGVSHVVDAARLDTVCLNRATLSLILRDREDASYEVGVVTASTRGEVDVHVAGSVVRAVLNGRRFRRHTEATAHDGEHRVTAPMPGKVVRVLVAAGDEVTPKQPLVVVEAMKMENELSVPRAGRVKDVLVAAGESVEAGRLLVIVE